MTEGNWSASSAPRVRPWEGKTRGHADSAKEGGTRKVQGEEAIVDTWGIGGGEQVLRQGELNTYRNLEGCRGGYRVYVYKGNG